MRIIVAGGRGWLGSALCRLLIDDGHDVVVLSRSRPTLSVKPGPRFVTWDGQTLAEWASEVDGADAIVNFSGESIAGARWTAKRKRLLRSSRIEPTAVLVDAIAAATDRPGVLVNASAVGYYGDRGEETVMEDTAPGTDFLARLVVDWEAAALRAVDLGTRTVVLRMGVVIGPGGGALDRLVMPFRWFVGGPIGFGNRWLPWIHIDDVVGLFRFALEREDVSGPINAVAPEPATYRDLAVAIGRALGRPSWCPDRKSVV